MNSTVIHNFLKLYSIYSYYKILAVFPESRHTCLVPDLGEKLSVFHCGVWSQLWVFPTWPLLRWDHFLLFLVCWACFFNHMRMLNFVKYFFCINWCALMGLTFILLMQGSILIDFLILNHPYFLGINPTLSWCVILLNLVCYCFVEDCSFHFLYCPYLALVSE